VGDEPDDQLNALVTAERVRSLVAGKATIEWPGADAFTAAIETGALYRRKIAGYAIKEFELSLKGETPSDQHQIEHIAPQQPTDVWLEAIPEDYDSLVHTWGNLLPLTPTMNPAQGQNGFAKKREAYADSIFASAREVAKMPEWNAESIRERSKRIAAWALTRWPY
jgi:hypothetical protein